VLNYWRQHAVSGDKIITYTVLTLKAATTLSRPSTSSAAVYLGFQVQQNCLEEFQARKPWVPGRLTKHGHAVYAVEYDHEGVTVLTWGDIQRATWAWWDECVDEAYAIIPPEAKKRDSRRASISSSWKPTWREVAD